MVLFQVKKGVTQRWKINVDSCQERLSQPKPLTAGIPTSGPREFPKIETHELLNRVKPWECLYRTRRGWSLVVRGLAWDGSLVLNGPSIAQLQTQRLSNHNGEKRKGFLPLMYFTKKPNLVGIILKPGYLYTSSKSLRLIYSLFFFLLNLFSEESDEKELGAMNQKLCIRLGSGIFSTLRISVLWSVSRCPPQSLMW